METNYYSSNNIKHLTKMALFLSLIIVSGFLSIPLPFVGVPIVLQNMMIMLAGGFLGKKYGFITVATFLMLVMVGFPLLAGGRSGIAVFLSPSLGFFVGYLLCPIVIGLLLEKSSHQSYVSIFLAYLIGGVLLINVLGSISLAYYSHTSWLNGLKMVVVFLPLDIVKGIVATLIHHRLQKQTFLGEKNESIATQK